MPLTPEILIPRLGDVLVEEGLITKEQLLAALENQKQMRSEGKSLLIGKVMIEMGLLDQNTLDQAITKHILILQNGLQKANETLEKRVEERTAELQEAYRKLSALAELKSNFVANISHELRTPLTHIMGYLDLILTGGIENFNDEQKESIQIIRKASDRLAHLIEDLILFSSSEVGSVSVQLESFNLPDLIYEAIEKNKSSAKKKYVHIQTSIPDQPVIVRADRGKILWVLNQLVDNAIKFNSNDGTVNISLQVNGKKAEVAITDTGIGIESKKIEEIFEPFHQLDGSTTRKQGGTGLGLTLVKKILASHNEKVIVRSTPGKGSSFSFSLDCVDKSE
jgi:signal transduction histidine kinase